MIVRVLLASVLVLSPGLASAQDSRAGEITDEQAQKATHLAPYETHWAENMLLRVRRALVEQPSGLYPYFGSVYNGGGFTLGAGYRYFTGDRSHFNVDGLYSISSYKLIEGHYVSPGHASGRLDFRVGGSWRDATQVQYHGLGIDSPADIDTAYRMQWGIVGGDATKTTRSRIRPAASSRSKARSRPRPLLASAWIRSTCIRPPAWRSTRDRRPTTPGTARCSG